MWRYKKSFLGVIAVALICMMLVSCGAAATIASILDNVATQADKIITQMEQSGNVPANILPYVTAILNGAHAVSAAIQQMVTGLALAKVIAENLLAVPLPTGLLPPPYDLLVPLLEGAVATLIALLPTAQHMPAALKGVDLSVPMKMTKKDVAAYSALDGKLKTLTQRAIALKAKAK